MARFCAKCGKPVPDGDRFCSACGAPVPQNDPPAVPNTPPAIRNTPPAVQSPPPAVQPPAAPYRPPVPQPANTGGKKQGGGKKTALIIGIVCGAAVLLIAAFLALYFMGLLPFGPSDGEESSSSVSSELEDSDASSELSSDVPASVSVTAGEDPELEHLKGLDMTFGELAEGGYEFGEDFDGNRTYIFKGLGKEAGFIFVREGPDGKSLPLGLVTTLEEVFPEMAGLTAEEAVKLYSPYLEVSEKDKQAVYETESYTFTISMKDPESFGGEDLVSATKKGAAMPTQGPSAEPTPTPAPTATPAPTPQPTPEKVESSFYILPQSNQRLLTYVDIQNFTKQDIMLARNEIFARHGRKFQDEDVRTYFESQTWYNGTIEPGDFSTSVFSDIEQKNVDFLKQYEDGLNGISQDVGSSGSVVTYSGYIIPQSSSRRLTYADIAGLSSWQLSMARNEIYARHGRKFNDADIRSYFESQSWYNGYIAPENFDTSVLSDTEVYNIDFILSYE